MEERNTGRSEKRHMGKPVHEHPKPQVGSMNSLNEVVRQELWYVDAMVASPFRTVRRQLQTSRATWAQGADEAIWALEGMTRLPIKFLQSAFGESFKSPSAKTTETGHSEGQ